MSTVSEEKQSQFDGIKWLLVIILLVAAIGGNYYFANVAESDPGLLYRILGVLVLIGLSGFVATRTGKGAAFMSLARGARTEMRKVVWPTAQERNQTTLMVLAVVILMALLLWGLDALFGALAKLVIG